MSTAAAPRWALTYVTRHVGEPTNWSPVHRRSVLFEVEGRAVLVWVPFFGKVRHSTLRITSRAAAGTAAPAASARGSAAARPAPSARAKAFGVEGGSSADEAEADVEEMLSGGYEVHGTKSAQLKSVAVTADGRAVSTAGARPVVAATDMPEVEDHTPEEPVHPRAPTSRYVGDVHPVIFVEGIGPKTAEALKRLGCTDTDQLGRYDPAELGAALGITARQVEDWQAMAELAKVKGIGRQYAEVLALSGVRGIQDLKSRSSRSIASKARAWARAQTQRPAGQEVTENKVIAWKEAAKACRRVPTTVLHPKAEEAAPAAPAAASAAASGNVHARSMGATWSDQKGGAPEPAKKEEVAPMRLGAEDLLVVRDRTQRKAVTVHMEEKPAEPAAPARKAPGKPIDLDVVEVKAARSNPLLTKVKANRAVVEDEKPAAQPERKTTVADGSDGPFGAIGGVEVKRDRRAGQK